MIDKPEGFDLRDRRSTKTSSAADWRPADALYSAWREIETTKPGEEPTCLFVAWKGADGRAYWRAAGGLEQIDSLLLRALTGRSG